MSRGDRIERKGRSPAQNRKKVTMTKSTITRVAALDLAIERMADTPEAVEVLTKLRDSLAKPRKKSDAPSKAKLENARLAQELADAIPTGEAVSPRWVTEHVRGVLTPQKAAAVAREGVALGLIEKVVDGRNVSYRRA